MYFSAGPLLALLVLLAPLALAQGEACDPSNSRLDPLTHIFNSDCNATMWCQPITQPPPLGNKPATAEPSSAILSAPAPPPTLSLTSGFLAQGKRAELERRGLGRQQRVVLGLAAPIGDLSQGLGRCVARGCRRDGFPFGYAPNATLPPVCKPGSFCPDDGRACQPTVALGEVCEMNRDDECTPPSDAALQSAWSDLSNYNGSICLSQRCQWANATLNNACMISNTVCTSFTLDVTLFTDVYTRDDCLRGLYCAPGTLTCLPVVPVTSPCSSDRECGSNNCGLSNTCELPPSTPGAVSPAVAVLVAALLAGAMAALVWWLLNINAGRREQLRNERRCAWEEQRRLRETFTALRRARGGADLAEKRCWSCSGSSRGH